MIQLWIKNFASEHKTLIVIALVFFVCLVLWMFGINVVNKVSNWFYDRGTQEAHRQIDKAKGEAAAAKAVAEEALKELAKEKERYEVEKKKREVAEQILADKTITTNEKLRRYEEAMQGAPIISPPASVDELCARARAAGVACE